MLYGMGRSFPTIPKGVDERSSFYHWLGKPGTPRLEVPRDDKVYKYHIPDMKTIQPEFFEKRFHDRTPEVRQAGMFSPLADMIGRFFERRSQAEKMKGVGVAPDNVKRIINYHGPGYKYRIPEGGELEWYRGGKWQRVPPIPEGK